MEEIVTILSTREWAIAIWGTGLILPLEFGLEIYSDYE